MEPNRPPLHRDLDFRPTDGRGILTPHDDPAAYLRVLANPFLGLLGIAAWFEALLWVERWARHHGPWNLAIIPAVAAGLLLPRLFHYHCLDCGSTGRLSRWREHACPVAEGRRLAGHRRRFRGPEPGVQVLFWIVGLVATLLVLLPVLRAAR